MHAHIIYILNRCKTSIYIVNPILIVSLSYQLSMDNVGIKNVHLGMN